MAVTEEETGLMEKRKENSTLLTFDLGFKLTFKSVRGSRSKVLVRMELERQLPVRLLQILVTAVFGNAQDFIEVLTILYPGTTNQQKGAELGQSLEPETSVFTLGLTVYECVKLQWRHHS